VRRTDRGPSSPRPLLRKAFTTRPVNSPFGETQRRYAWPIEFSSFTGPTAPIEWVSGFADFILAGMRARGESAELIDAKVVGLPMLDRMYKEYPRGGAPPAMEALAGKISRR